MDDHSPISAWVGSAKEQLTQSDPQLWALAGQELARQERTLSLVASASPTLAPALLAQSLLFSSVTAEGYPGARYHPGTQVVDQVEQLAIDRAQQLFGSPYVNVQPLSGSAANLAVLYGLVGPDRNVLAMDLAAGGHLTHVSGAASISKRIAGNHYGLNSQGLIDFDQVADLARTTRPAVIICGGSSYARQINFARFREIADSVDALLMADISHISGLIAAGEHPSPVPHCDVITTSTYKQLCGPRGGLIMLGSNARISEKQLRRAVFPGFQGTPDFGGVAAKAVAFGFAQQPAFITAMQRVRAFASTFASAFSDREIDLVSDGTDTHMVLVDLRSLGDTVTGRSVSDALMSAGVMVNKNLIPGDLRSPTETSGLRIGTNHLAFSGVSLDAVDGLAQAVAALVQELAQGQTPESMLTVSERASHILRSGALPGWPQQSSAEQLLLPSY